MLQRAVDRGEIRADNPAIEYVLHMLLGAFVARHADRRTAADPGASSPSYIDAVVLPALGA